MSISRKLKIHYIYIYGDSGWCHRLCPLFRGCPLLGGSVNRGFTVYIIYYSWRLFNFQIFMCIQYRRSLPHLADRSARCGKDRLYCLRVYRRHQPLSPYMYSVFSTSEIRTTSILRTTDKTFTGRSTHFKIASVRTSSVMSELLLTLTYTY